MKHKRGFTLIELLVVIAVIGLLASVVFVNLQSSRGKAKIAAGQQFDSQLKSVLGAYAVGSWRFEEGSGVTTKDEAGTSGNATLSGGVTWRTTAECGLGLGGCLEFGGVNGKVTVGNNANLNITNNLTIAFWMKAVNGNGWYPRIVSRMNFASKIGYMVYNNLDSSLGFIVGNGSATPVAGASYAPNEWTHIVGVFEQPNLKLYVNGTLKGTATMASSITSYDANLLIGDGYDGGIPFKGSLDEVRIYNSSLTISEIQKLYAQGLKTHPIAEEKQ